MLKKTIALSSLCVVLAVGCDRDADCLARVARCAACKGEAAAADAGAFNAIRSNLDELTLEAKVSARLRWDKSLEGVQIEVHAVNGVVELKGGVAKEEQRKRAVEIAEATVGVDKVVDSLTVNTPAS